LLVVPLTLIETILREYHDKNAHMARNRLRDILSARFYWFGMTNHIRDWVNACVQCRRFKSDRPLQHGLLTPIVTTHPFQLVSMDIKGPLHLSKGRNRYILVIIDHFTNWIEAAPLKTLTAQEVIELILSNCNCASWLSGRNSH
jgi:hypothetical protein